MGFPRYSLWGKNQCAVMAVRKPLEEMLGLSPGVRHLGDHLAQAPCRHGCEAHDF